MSTGSCSKVNKEVNTALIVLVSQKIRWNIRTTLANYLAIDTVDGPNDNYIDFLSCH